MKRIISLLLVLIMAAGVFLQTPVLVFADEDLRRDTVLILDESGSMYGNPMDRLMESAEKFCESVLSASGKNRVAIVTYSTYATLICDFTDDLNYLSSEIRNMYAYGRTDIYDALQIGGELLNNSSADVKNIVLMSDGLPNEGEMVYNGKYVYNDYTGYEYANAVYDEAVSFHNDFFIYTLGFFHNISGDTKAFASRFMEDLQNAGYYEVSTVDDLEFTFGEIADDITETKVKGRFSYSGGSKDYSSEYYYADEYFYESSFKYNQSLATMSLCLAMSAFGSADVSSYENKSINVKNLMGELMFTDFEVTESFKEKPSADSIAAAAGHKKIKDKDGNIYTLIAVAVRGGGYEQEWAGNITLGLGENHSGFDTAANQVMSFLKKYISDYGIDGDIKLWITGFSRAAATSNLVAGYLDSGMSLGGNVVLKRENLFAYCFETPAGTTNADARRIGLYGNIFNIINPNDPVTKVAPAAMGFKRYGVDKILPTNENKYNSLSEDTEKMLKQYEKIESAGEYVVDKFSFKKVSLSHILPGGKEVIYDSEYQMSLGTFLDEMLRKLFKVYINRTEYYYSMEDGVRELCKAIFQDESKAERVLSLTLEKIKDKGLWLLLKYPYDEMGVYNEVAGCLVESLEENGAGNFDGESIKTAAEPLIDSLLAFLSNNIDYAVTVYKNKDYFFPAHYPELCLAWMRSMDENYTTDAGDAFSSGSYRIIRINCPVNVSVFDSFGNLVALVTDGEAERIDNSTVTSLINSDGEMLLYLPADSQFRIEMLGTDIGKVNFSVNEYSFEAGQINRIVNYYDVPIEKGRTLNAVVPQYDIKYISNGTQGGTDTNYTLFDMNGNVLNPDADISGESVNDSYCNVSAVSENEEYGMAYGSGSRLIGNYIMVTAIANENYIFDGWYENEKKISDDAEYRFCVKGDVKLVAKFISPALPVISENVSPSKSDESSVNDALIVSIIALIFLLIVVVAVIAVILLSRGKTEKDEELTNIHIPYSRTVHDTGAVTTGATEKISGVIRINCGSLRGFSVPVKTGVTVFLGKDSRFSQIVFTSDYRYVSRLHCSITYDAKTNGYFVVDTSTNGTYLVNKQRLEKGRRTWVKANTILILGNEDCMILLI